VSRSSRCWPGLTAAHTPGVSCVSLFSLLAWLDCCAYACGCEPTLFRFMITLVTLALRAGHTLYCMRGKAQSHPRTHAHTRTHTHTHTHTLHLGARYRHVDYLSFHDPNAVQRFISAWNKTAKQRYGILYGTYEK
jgi:hypothetical protein